MLLKLGGLQNPSIAGWMSQKSGRQVGHALQVSTFLLVIFAVLGLAWAESALAQSFAQSDLQGTWRFYSFSDDPGRNDPGTLGGILTFNGSGTLTSGTIFDVFGDSLSLTGGTVIVNSNGIVSGNLSAAGISLTLTEFKIDADKTLAAGVGVDDAGSRGIIILIKQTGSFVQSDLTGTWRIYSFSDLFSSNAPNTARGSVTFNSGGTVTGGTLTLSDGSSISLTGGSVSFINSAGQFAGSLATNVPGYTETLVEFQMDADKTFAAGIGFDSTFASTGSEFLAVAVKTGGSFTQGDLTGTWHFYDFFDSPAANSPGTTRGTITFNSSGAVTGGTLTDSGGTAFPVTGGSMALDSTGMILNGTVGIGGQTNTVSEFKMDLEKTVAAGVGFDNAGFRFLGIAVKAGTVTGSKLINISTRGTVQAAAAPPSDLTMIGGFVINGQKQVLIRARGPLLTALGVPGGGVSDPRLILLNQQTGAFIGLNDDWQANLCALAGCGNAAQITATGLDPCSTAGVVNFAGCTKEAAILITLPQGAYTAIVEGIGASGNGLVEIFEVP